MKIKRQKKIQRYISFFEKNFGFRTPYQVLVDGTFANAALINKVNIKEQLPKYLDAAVKVLTTPCVLQETERLGAVVGGALQILRRFPVHKCEHKESPVAAAKCLKSMVKPSLSNRYIVATQDNALREKLREFPGVALLYLHGNAPTLEAPSEKNQKVAGKLSLKKVDIADYQKQILDHIKESENLLESTSKPAISGTKKRKRAGPNPLSCKKSKKKQNQQQPSTSTSTSQSEGSAAKKKNKRKRSKVKIPKHVQQELKSISQP